MPDMGAWSCSPFGLWAAPASVLNTALYLTATSTSTEAGDAAGATTAPKARPPKEVPAPAAGKKPATIEPQEAEASQILANPFGLKNPAVVSEKPNQAASDNKAGSNAPASNPTPEKADSNAGTSPNQAANEETPKNAALVPIPAYNQAATAVPAAAPNAVANVVITSTNAQGSVVVTTSQAPGLTVTSTNAQGSQVVTTMPIVSPQAFDHTPKPAPVVINGHTLTTDSQSHYLIAGSTLELNTPLILGSGASTTPVILQSSGIHPVLVIGSSTTTLTLPSSSPTPTTTTPPALTIGSQTITSNAQGQYVVGTQTLTPGGEIVVGGTTAPGVTVALGGTTVSLATSATLAVVGSSTEGLAPFIIGGLGAGPNGTGGVVRFLGGAEGGGRRGLGLWWMAALVGGVVGIVGWWL